MIQFFDKFMNRLEDLDFIEVAWNRKWTEAGDFSVRLAAQDWNQHVKFVKNTGRPEIGIVQKTVYEVTAQGTFATISGFFAEKALDGVALHSDENVNEKDGTVIFGLFANINTSALGQYSRTGGSHEIPPSIVGQVWGDYDAKWMPELVYSFKAGTGAATTLYDACALYGMSFNVELAPPYKNNVDWVEEWMRKIEEPHFLYKVKPTSGRDLRANVFFGTGWSDVSKIEYVYDDSAVIPIIEIRQTMDETGFKNEEYITDEQGNTKSMIREFYIDENNRPKDLDLYPKKIIQGSVSGIELKVANESVIREQMRNQGKLEMLNHWKQETINVDVLQNTFYYLKDYNLGDICTIVLDDIEQMFAARIVEVKEVHRKNAVEVQLVMGTPYKQKYVALNI